MSDSYDTATRIIFVYESMLPFGRPVRLDERVEAMRKAVESMGLTERDGNAQFKDLLRVAEGVQAAT